MTNGWWYFGRRRAGSQMLGACNRMWVHVWCGAPGCIHSYIAKGLQKRLGGSWLSPPLIVTQSYWCDILGLCIVSWILQCLIKDRRLSYHSCMSARMLQVHLPQLLGSEQNVDVPIPLSVDTSAWTPSVPPQTGVETTDLLRMRQKEVEVIRSSHLISHTYVKVRDEGGDKIWATPYIFEHKICAHTQTHRVANNSQILGATYLPLLPVMVLQQNWGFIHEVERGYPFIQQLLSSTATCTDHGLPHSSLKNHAPQAWSAWASKGDEEEPTCKHLWSLRIPEYFHAWGKLTPYSVNTR